MTHVCLSVYNNYQSILGTLLRWRNVDSVAKLPTEYLPGTYLEHKCPPSKCNCLDFIVTYIQHILKDKMNKSYHFVTVCDLLCVCVCECNKILATFFMWLLTKVASSDNNILVQLKTFFFLPCIKICLTTTTIKEYKACENSGIVLTVHDRNFHMFLLYISTYKRFKKFSIEKNKF